MSSPRDPIICACVNITHTLLLSLSLPLPLPFSSFLFLPLPLPPSPSPISQLPKGSAVQRMAMQCWCLHFQSQDHSFLLQSNMFSNISKALSGTEEGDGGNSEKRGKGDKVYIYMYIGVSIGTVQHCNEDVPSMRLLGQYVHVHIIICCNPCNKGHFTNQTIFLSYMYIMCCIVPMYIHVYMINTQDT